MHIAPDMATVRALAKQPRPARERVVFALLLLAGAVFYALCLQIADVSASRLLEGLPRLWTWMQRAWPPDVSELDVLLYRAAETVAMATVGVSFGAAIAVPVCLLAARNTAPTPWLYYPARFVLNILRGIDSFIFALIFVAAVGLGPFAGVLGIAVHVAGSIAKLWSEAIETAEPGPIEAARMTGAGRLKVVTYALLPDVMPSFTSILLYMWEFNIRASTVLGIVGAGGIGQELKNSIDLLLFDRVFTTLLIILAMVTAIDALSAWLRRRLT
ncbi:MAG: phosphonate ABC transporter, permease protein PhnE [Hyphomicrobiaceae bacterium]